MRPKRKEAPIRTALIYRNELLPVSETFIQAQAQALEHFKPQFVGVHRSAKALPVPQDAIFADEYRHFPKAIQSKLYFLVGAMPFLHRSAFRRRLEALQASLVHAHFAMDGLTAAPLARMLGIPLIVTLHGYDVTVADESVSTSLRGRAYLARRPHLWRQASLFICVSEFIRRKALEAGFPKDKLRVHYIGVDRKAFSSHKRVGGREIVLFVGRLVEKKGCEYLIRAMARVQERIRQAELIVIGDGPLRESLQFLAQSLKVDCKFLGSQSTEVVRDWLSVARVFCSPSVTAKNGDSEGLPIVILEAQAMGVPVIGSNHAGIPEAVRDGETGLLTPERDDQHLADCIYRLLVDDIVWKTYSRTAVDWIKKRFDLHNQTNELESIYEQISATQVVNAPRDCVPTSLGR